MGTIRAELPVWTLCARLGHSWPSVVHRWSAVKPPDSPLQHCPWWVRSSDVVGTPTTRTAWVGHVHYQHGDCTPICQHLLWAAACVAWSTFSFAIPCPNAWWWESGVLWTIFCSLPILHTDCIWFLWTTAFPPVYFFFHLNLHLASFPQTIFFFFISVDLLGPSILMQCTF